MLKVAVIGAGYWGKNLVRVFKELGVLKTVCDIDKNKLKKHSALYPGINTTTSVEEVLADRDVGAVAIATPADTHHQLAKKALGRRKHVFVEKPLALKVSEGEEVLALARDMGRILMVGHILNYHPAVIKLKSLIDKGKLGKIEHIYSNRLNIGKLRTEENILWSFAPHDISAMLMLLGEEPVDVIASGGDYVNKGIYDITMTVLEFKNGVKGHIFVSWLHPFKEQKLIVVGSKAMAVFDNLTREKLFLYPHRIEWKNDKAPVALKAKHFPVIIKNKEPLKEEARHFIKCVSKGITPKTDAKEGVRVLKILEKAEESIRNKKSFKGISRCGEIFVHPTACVDENVKIGKGAKIWHHSHILKNTELGRDCIIGQNVAIGPDVKIGNGCKIQNNVSVYKGVTLEDDVFCGPSCVFTNVYSARAFIERKSEFLPTLVRKGATIGANATIICGTTIGRFAFIGAGTVVTKDVADYGLVVGVPGKRMGWVCRCGVPLRSFDKKGTARCKRCGNSYRSRKDRLEVIKEKD